MRAMAIRCLLGLAGVLLGVSAQALTFSPNPVPVSDFGGLIEGEAELVAVVTGTPVGGVVLGGAVSPTAQTIVFRTSVSVGSADFLIAGVQLAGSGGSWVDVNGFGWISGADTDITSAVEGLPGTVLFTPASSVAAGQSFDLVFLSYDTPLAWDGSLEFAFGLALVPETVGLGLLVPEPGALLALAGLLTAALRGGRRR